MLNISQNQLSSGQLRLVKEFAREMADTGINFFVYDRELNIIVNICGEKFISDYEGAAAFAKQLLDSQTCTIQQIGPSGRFVGCCLVTDGTVNAIIIIDSGPECIAAALVRQTLHLFIRSFQNELKNAQQIELISGELAQTYEELMLLYKISTNMRVSQTDANFLQLACDNLIEIVRVEGIAIFLEKKIEDNKKLILSAGTGLLGIDYKNESMIEILFERLLDSMAAGSDALIDSEVNGIFKYEWQGRIRNIIAVPLSNNSKLIGVMVATNLLDRNDFDKNDIKLFNAVATECAVFIGNHNLFKDLKGLLIGALKSLVNSIDAKDQYTRGHSDRVAIISKWIAEQYAKSKNLSREEIQKIYLSGLLHDIGKIGIKESVLKKPGKLTDEEYEEMKNHPAIGAGIISEINQMEDIVPGILYHHERFDGKGYPKGLAGNNIPIAGKIVMIADSFDAMTSQRTYHKAMSLEEAIVEIEKNLGKQFDPIIGGIFLKSNLNRLWEMLQTGQTGDLYTDNINDYGTFAVGALLS
jgi:HD-GYP domain-containing protein (c-di-GMP phosphodiesterase class II)